MEPEGCLRVCVMSIAFAVSLMIDYAAAMLAVRGVEIMVLKPAFFAGYNSFFGM